MFLGQCRAVNRVRSDDLEVYIRESTTRQVYPLASDELVPMPFQFDTDFLFGSERLRSPQALNQPVKCQQLRLGQSLELAINIF